MESGDFPETSSLSHHLFQNVIMTDSDTIKNYLNYSNPYFGDGEQAFSFLNPEYIHNNLLGYCLITFVQK